MCVVCCIAKLEVGWKIHVEDGLETACGGAICLMLSTKLLFKFCTILTTLLCCKIAFQVLYDFDGMMHRKNVRQSDSVLFLSMKLTRFNFVGLMLYHFLRALAHSVLPRFSTLDRLFVLQDRYD